MGFYDSGLTIYRTASLAANNIKAKLMKSTYAPQDTHTSTTDLGADECDALNYSEHSFGLLSRVQSGSREYINADANWSWSNLSKVGTQTVRWIVLYEATGSKLIAFYDLNAAGIVIPEPATPITLNIQVNSSGLVQIVSV